jgi:hypothetical protein
VLKPSSSFDNEESEQISFSTIVAALSQSKLVAWALNDRDSKPSKTEIIRFMQRAFSFSFSFHFIPFVSYYFADQSNQQQTPVAMG